MALASPAMPPRVYAAFYGRCAVDSIVHGATIEKLGWHWWPSDSAILTRPYDGRDACNNCGPCDIGCSRGAKASADVTYWPKAVAQGAVLRPHARVREITVNTDAQILAALAASPAPTPRVMLSRLSLPDAVLLRKGFLPPTELAAQRCG